MGNQRRIGLKDIVVGRPLPWDVMDSTGHLLLRKGFIIEKQTQAEALVARGMYIDNTHAESTRSAVTPPPAKNEPPSVLRTINLVVRRLGAVLRDFRQLPDAREKILEVVKMTHYALRLNEDLALACILLNQSSGPYSVRHCVDTAILATLVAQAMNKSEQEIQDIGAAALTMNIAMLGMHEKLQGKQEPLSTEEREYIHSHPELAIDILRNAGIEDANWLLYVLQHHEHEDGTGYPTGVMKDEISQNAKILSLADGFCARISARGYRKSTLPNIALRDIFIENGAKVEPLLGAYFIKVLSLYPPGTFVRLNNEEIAVISQRGAGPTASVAYSLVNTNGEVIGTPIKRDTNSESFNIKEALHPTRASAHFNLQQVWGPLASL